MGLAASVGAGISMAFAEALSDDGSLTGRGAPVMRGAVTGIMTTVGGLGHTLPYLIPDFWTATVVADHRRGDRTGGDLVYPAPLHGHAVPGGRFSGCDRRRSGVSRGHHHRQLVNVDLRPGAPVGPASRPPALVRVSPNSPASGRSATSTGGASAAASIRARSCSASSRTSKHRPTTTSR